MGLEDFTPSESADAGGKSSEISEVFKESVKRSSAGIKRVAKDEKKAKKYDQILASFLVEIIRDKKYDFLLKDLFKSLDNGFNSNFILGILSLIYLPISYKIRELSKKKQINFNYVKSFEIIEFDDNNLDDEIKNRINFWMEDIIDIISLEYSSLQMENIKKLFKKKNEFYTLLNFTSSVFQFFFKELNINIDKNKSNSYIDFILSQVFEKINQIEIENI